MPIDPSWLTGLSPGARIIIILVLILAGVVTKGLAIVARKVDASIKASERAAELSAPTGNGFARRVEAQLTALTEGQSDIKASIRRLQHTDQHTSDRLDRLEGPAGVEAEDRRVVEGGGWD